MRDPFGLTIWLRSGGGAWTAIGTGAGVGVRPERFRARATRRGSDTCSFDLRRDPKIPYSDLGAWTPCEVEVAGVKVWAGQVKETPSSEGEDGAMINVQGRGLVGHLDDDRYQAVYVHDRLGDYADARAKLVANLATYVTGWSVDTGATITFGYPGPAPTGGGYTRSGVVLDTGVAGGAKKVVADWTRSGVWAGDSALAITVGDDLTDVLSRAFADASVTTSSAGANSGTMATGAVSGRYVLVFAQSSAVQASEVFARLTAVRVFGDAAYESGGQSVLKSSQLVADAVEQATQLLSADRSGIQATTFTVPSYVMDGVKTPGEVCDFANALENRLLAVDLDGRIVFAPLPTSAKWEIGPWAGAEFKDASLNSGDEIFNRVQVTGTGPDGLRVFVERAATGTAVDAQGFRRTQELAIRNPVTAAVATRIGDLWLSAHSTTPLKGEVQVIGTGGVRSVVGGAAPHPAWLLRDGGQLLRLSGRVDPDTGAFGRDGRIDAVDYDHDTLTASISLDNDRRSVDALLERLAVVVGSS